MSFITIIFCYRLLLLVRNLYSKTVFPSFFRDFVLNIQNRYGPWALLYKSRFATIPQMDGSFSVKQENLDFYEKDWEEYSDHSTVDSIGLKDGSRLMFEYAIMRKDGKL